MDGKLDRGSEKEDWLRGGRSGNFGIFTGSKIVGEPGRELILFFKRGFSMIVESEREEEKREECWEGIMKERCFYNYLFIYLFLLKNAFCFSALSNS